MQDPRYDFVLEGNLCNLAGNELRSIIDSGNLLSACTSSSHLGNAKGERTLGLNFTYTLSRVTWHRDMQKTVQFLCAPSSSSSTSNLSSSAIRISTYSQCNTRPFRTHEAILTSVKVGSTLIKALNKDLHSKAACIEGLIAYRVQRISTQIHEFGISVDLLTPNTYE